MLHARVGFVGFGEVGSVFSKAIREKGAEVSAYDVNLTRPEGPARLRKRVRAEGIRFLPLEEVVRGSECVLSTVRPQTALEAARACAGHLRAGQTYVDLNSTSPSVKAEIGRLIGPSGAAFVEGAILGAVGAAGAAARVLTGGEHGRAAAEALTRLGLQATYYSPEIGKASLFKMLRSIFSKGLEALLLELLLSGRRAGIERDLWEDVMRFMTENPFEKVASNWILSHPAACGRRHHEMEQVAEVMRGAGIEPLMTGATEAFFRRSSACGLREAFTEKPADPGAVAEALERRLPGGFDGNGGNNGP